MAYLEGKEFVLLRRENLPSQGLGVASWVSPLHHFKDFPIPTIMSNWKEVAPSSIVLRQIRSSWSPQAGYFKLNFWRKWNGQSGMKELVELFGIASPHMSSYSTPVGSALIRQSCWLWGWGCEKPSTLIFMAYRWKVNCDVLSIGLQAVASHLGDCWMSWYKQEFLKLAYLMYSDWLRPGYISWVEDHTLYNSV